MEKQAAVTTVNTVLFEQIVSGNIGNLVRYIDTIVAASGDDMLAVVNRFLAVPAHLGLLISHIVNQPESLGAVIKGSYYHENGFHKIVLLSGNHFKLRLHHFGCGVKLPMENVHDHRWAFASSILAGSLRMDLFEVNDHTGEPVIHYCYDSNKSSGAYNTQPLGHKYVRTTNTRTFRAGEQYLMLPTELHRITNQPGEESITLILTGNPVGTTCNLYARREITSAEKKPVAYTPEVMVAMLLALREKINPQNN